MKSALIEVLDALGYEYFLQGTYDEDKPYPDRFITFQTLDSPETAAFDNETALTAWTYQIIFYSNDPEEIDAAAELIRKAFKNAGFDIPNKGRDIISDEPSHTGWIIPEVIYTEKEGVLL